MRKVMTALDKAISGALGKFALGILLSILLGLGKFQLDYNQSNGDKIQQVGQQVIDLSAKVDDKYNDIKGQVQAHYEEADRQAEIVRQTLAEMSVTLSTQAAELAEVRGELSAAKVQEQIDIERTNVPSHESRRDPPPLLPPITSIPIIGPLLPPPHPVRHIFKHHGRV